jgi:hypothetical protein
MPRALLQARHTLSRGAEMGWVKRISRLNCAPGF